QFSRLVADIRHQLRVAALQRGGAARHEVPRLQGREQDRIAVVGLPARVRLDGEDVAFGGYAAQRELDVVEFDCLAADVLHRRITVDAVVHDTAHLTESDRVGRAARG